jgi:hypothetical protein
MAPKKTQTQRKNYERLKVCDNFFTERYSSEYYPSGVIRVKRVTLRTPSFSDSNFAMESVRIKTPEELDKVKHQIDYLAQRLGWKELAEHIETVREQLEKRTQLDPRALKLVEQYPEAVIEMVKTLDKILGKRELTIEEIPLVRKFTDTLLNALLGKKELMIDLNLNLVKRLGKETDPRGITELLKLLEEYELPQLTSVTGIITDRLQKLKLLEAQIQNEKTYEIKGKNSIHNQLAEALWILDDRYWLLSSNKPLQNLLGKTYEKKKSGKRPDFICADFEKTLVIVEIKRPSLKVERKHIDQLEEYIIMASDFQEYEEKIGYLVAKKISKELRRLLNHRPLIKFKSYSQVIKECRTRYKQYLDAVEKRKK